MRIIKRKTPLYCQFREQFEPQPVYLEIDREDETIRMDYDREIGGGVPFDVYHKEVLRYYIDGIPTVSEANDLMARVSPIDEEVAAGHVVEWDGSNWVGSLSDEAAEAEEELKRVLEGLSMSMEQQEVWGWEWFDMETSGLDRGDVSDEELLEKVDEMESLAESEVAVIDCNLQEELMCRRNRRRAEEIEEILGDDPMVAEYVPAYDEACEGENNPEYLATLVDGRVQRVSYNDDGKLTYECCLAAPKE